MKYIQEVKARANIVQQGTVVVAYVKGENKIVYLDGDPLLDTFVDMGLPSGTLWAKVNLGAEDEADTGDRFYFGETQGYQGAELEAKINENYKPQSYESGWWDSGEGNYENNKITDKNNAVKVIMGNGFDIPKYDDFSELVDYSDMEIIEINGRKGLKLTSQINGNVLILPCWFSNIYYSGVVYYQSPCRSIGGSGEDIIETTVIDGESNDVSFSASPVSLPCPIRPIKKYVFPTEMVFVDMGLPSGTLWANKNLGAETEIKGGDYYYFGETQGYQGASLEAIQAQEHTSPYDEWSRIIWAQQDRSTYEDKWANYEITDAYNAAKVVGNSEWDIPNEDEWTELSSNCTFEVVRNYKGSDVDVIVVTSTINGNHLVFPITHIDYQWDAEYTLFHTKQMDGNDNYGGSVARELRGYGISSYEGSFNVPLPIRPIRKVTQQSE